MSELKPKQMFTQVQGKVKRSTKSMNSNINVNGTTNSAKHVIIDKNTDFAAKVVPGLRGQSVKRRKSRILLEPHVVAAYSKITSIEHERNSSKTTEIKSVQDLRNPKITINNVSNCAEIKILGSEEIVCPAHKESKMIFEPLKWMKVLKSKSKHSKTRKENKRKSTIWPKWLKLTRKINSSKAKKSAANQEQKDAILKEEETKTMPVKKDSISKNLNISQLSKLSKVNFVTQKKGIKSKFM
jgi:hypothetical protein